MRGVSRRRVLLLSAAAAASAATPTLPVRAAGVSDEQHGMSAFGDLAYPAGFTHFAHADPGAPKGGTVLDPWVLSPQAMTFPGASAKALEAPPINNIVRSTARVDVAPASLF